MNKSTDKRVNFSFMLVLTGQRVVKHNETTAQFRPDGILLAYFIQRIRPYRRLAYKPRSSTATGDLWHLRMGHAGPKAIRQLQIHYRGAHVTSKAPNTKKCPLCARSKVKRQISRKSADQVYIISFQKMHIDWINELKGIYDENRAMFITYKATGMVLCYFFISKKEFGNFDALKRCI
jgi:hypothetical protein